ncbi:serine O-acetyltransferase [Rhodoblastus sp.]|jgi:serine O-acetyltransferase|uniref:serine O-acetyltransferase n=1 Tax=Rhodoblastus sp. TaxID=1962975 RepID=UPI0025EED12B|nr:serine O-acetyltransferase [Rhodoblastus sp.]
MKSSKSPGKERLWKLWRDDVACVKARDPAARNVLEVVLTYPGVHAIIWHRLANRLWLSGFKFPARFVSWFARLVTNVDIHPGATIGRSFFIDHGAGVVIGETAEIGDNVTMYHGVTLGGVSWSPGRRHPIIEDGVLIGAGAKILGPIKVGGGARIGANSVVVEEVPPGVTAVGIPARIVRAPTTRSAIGTRVNLDHHLIADPVGEVLSLLLDRVEFLEARLNHMQRRARKPEAACEEKVEG